MKEQSEKAVKKGTRSYFYAVLGCIAVLLAAAIVITAVALSGKKDNVANEPNNPSEIVTPDDPTPDQPDKPDQPDDPAPVIKPDGFYAPVANMDSLNQYGFYYNKTLNCYHLHDGIDFAATAGDKVFAADDGVIEEVYTSDLLCGGKIVIKHANDVRTVYEYVDVAAGLKAGDSVTRGQEIAAVAAATGAEYKEGAHLHFEVIENGSSVDPSKYLTMEEK